MERPTHLRETAHTTRGDTRVIDANYVVVSGGKRSWMAKLKLAAAAALIAALLGMLTPPLWVAASTLTRAFSTY